jgi:hypothetical protein
LYLGFAALYLCTLLVLKHSLTRIWAVALPMCLPLVSFCSMVPGLHFSHM